MARYNVGDKVRVRDDLERDKHYYMDDSTVCDDVVSEMLEFRGKIVTIEEITIAGKYKIVEDWWNWTDGMFEPIGQPNKIVITTDGKTTTAKMYRDKTVVGVETTKCHPDDRFDFMVGARVAFDRLVGEDAKKGEAPKTIEVGDTVKVIDTGCLYTTYREWVKKYIKDEYERFAYDIRQDTNTSHNFKVTVIHPHIEDKRKLLAYIKDIETGRCYLIGIEGLGRVSE